MAQRLLSLNRHEDTEAHHIFFLFNVRLLYRAIGHLERSKYLTQRTPYAIPSRIIRAASSGTSAGPIP